MHVLYYAYNTNSYNYHIREIRWHGTAKTCIPKYLVLPLKGRFQLAVTYSP